MLFASATSELVYLNVRQLSQVEPSEQVARIVASLANDPSAGLAVEIRLADVHPTFAVE